MYELRYKAKTCQAYIDLRYYILDISKSEVANYTQR